jgi:hypothetical protein
MSDSGEGSFGEARMVKKFLVAMGEDIVVLVVVGVTEVIGGCWKLGGSRGLFIPLVIQPEWKLP